MNFAMWSQPVVPTLYPHGMRGLNIKVSAGLALWMWTSCGADCWWCQITHTAKRDFRGPESEVSSRGQRASGMKQYQQNKREFVFGNNWFFEGVLELRSNEEHLFLEFAILLTLFSRPHQPQWSLIISLFQNPVWGGCSVWTLELCWTFLDTSLCLQVGHIEMCLCLQAGHTWLCPCVYGLNILASMSKWYHCLLSWLFVCMFWLCGFCCLLLVKTRAPQNVPLQLPIHTDQEYVK